MGTKKECPSCAVEIDIEQSRCPICGYEFPQQKSHIRWIALILALLFLWPLIRLLTSLFN